ncbi:hypothetical protein ACLM5H_16800 [Fredinandcohnia humi]
MSKETLYFKDNFFSADMTDIYNDAKEKVGVMDLKSAFTSTVDVLNSDGKLVVSGKFPFFGMSWKVLDNQGNEIGSLKQKFTFFSKKYEYHSYNQGTFYVKSEAFSRHYEILQGETNVIATFDRTDGFFASPAYRLNNQSDVLSSFELIIVIMGVNSIEQQNQSSTNSNTI